MCLQVKVEWKDGEWTPYWIQEEALTAGKKGDFTKVCPCGILVVGTIGYEVCWAKPVADDIGVLLTWSLRYRSRGDVSGFSPYTIRVRDPFFHTVLRVLTGPQARCYAFFKREWTCQESARDELDIMFEEQCDKYRPGRASARAETLLHDCFLAKEGLGLNDLPGIIRSAKHLLLYLEGAVVDGMPASQAFGLFIHDNFENKLEDIVHQRSLRSLLNNVVDVLRLDPPGRIEPENPLQFEPTIVRGLADELGKKLNEHCGLLSSGPNSKGSLFARAQRVLTALGVHNAMSFNEVAEYLRRNEAGHDAHRNTEAERCGQHDGGGQGTPYTEGQMRKGLAVARHYFLQKKKTDKLEWTQGRKYVPATPQAMNGVLQHKFQRFLREYDGGPLEPGFAELANWALAAWDTEDYDEDDIKSFLVGQQQELAEETIYNHR